MTDSTISGGLVAVGEAPADDPDYVPDPKTFVAAIEETARRAARSLIFDNSEVFAKYLDTLGLRAQPRGARQRIVVTTGRLCSADGGQRAAGSVGERAEQSLCTRKVGGPPEPPTIPAPPPGWWGPSALPTRPGSTGRNAIARLFTTRDLSPAIGQALALPFLVP
jgi:hypothetical protein